jgi:predicted polyphosphate/ATP-dependent NAD kinase
MRRKRLGLVVNPLAGMGGKVGLKGTDGAATIDEARRRGAVPHSAERARQALQRLAAYFPEFELWTAAGAMGEASAAACGVKAHAIVPAPSGHTTAADTRIAATAFADAEVDLLLFAGGDGTARDVHDAVGGRVPVLGVPTGVKMHSAVFATTAANAGEIAATYLQQGEMQVRLRDAEVMDIDEEAVRRGRVSARLHGYLRSPYERRRVQNAKAGAPADDAQLEALCVAIARRMDQGRLYIVGPGTTTQRVLAHAGLDGTLLGVDVVQDGAVVARDADEKDLVALLDGRPATLILGVVGGQGFLLGRGNQQIGPEVVRCVGRENILVLATTTKILSLPEPNLFVDTGDEEVDRGLAGFIRVHTGPGRSLLCRVSQ